jgi:hypothetical protein
MSAPPPYSASRPTENPERRPLPHGWTTQYDHTCVLLHLFYYLNHPDLIVRQLPVVVRWHRLAVMAIPKLRNKLRLDRYYVDTTKNPPQSQWNHPQDRHSVSSPQQNFSPSPNPSPNRPPFNPPYQQGPPQSYSGGAAYNQTLQYPVDQQDPRGFPSQQPFQGQPGPGYVPPNQYRNQQWSGWQQQQQPQSGTHLLARRRCRDA